MLSHVPRPMFVDYFSSFAPWCHTVIVDKGCQSTVGNDGFKCSVAKNTIVSETGDESAIECSDVHMLDSGSSGNKSVTWSDIVVCVHKDGSIEYERMSLEGGTAEGSIGVSKSKIPVGLENGKVWQPSGKP